MSLSPVQLAAALARAATVPQSTGAGPDPCSGCRYVPCDACPPAA